MKKKKTNKLFVLENISMIRNSSCYMYKHFVGNISILPKTNHYKIQ